MLFGLVTEFHAMKHVIGPDGTLLMIANLPPPGARWVGRRKAELVAAVRGGLISLEEACSRYALSVDEFLAWEHAIKSYGLRGLSSTRIQHHRQTF